MYVPTCLSSLPLTSVPPLSPQLPSRLKPHHSLLMSIPSFSSHTDASSPPRPSPRSTVEFDTSAEALLFTPAGLPLHGLTGGFGVERRVEHIIPEGARKSGRYEVWVEMSCNGLFGQNNMDPPDVSTDSS